MGDASISRSWLHTRLARVAQLRAVVTMVFGGPISLVLGGLAMRVSDYFGTVVFFGSFFFDCGCVYEMDLSRENSVPDLPRELMGMRHRQL